MTICTLSVGPTRAAGQPSGCPAAVGLSGVQLERWVPVVVLCHEVRLVEADGVSRCAAAGGFRSQVAFHPSGDDLLDRGEWEELDEAPPPLLVIGQFEDSRRRQWRVCYLHFPVKPSPTQRRVLGELGIR